MKKMILLTLVLFLSACAPSEEAIQTVMAQTQAAFTPTPKTIPSSTPEPTPTLIPFSELNLEDILLLPGDLPDEFTMQQISSEYPYLHFPANITPDQVLQMKLRAGDYASDGVVIILFKSIDDVTEIYPKAKTLWKVYNSDEVTDVGENVSANTDIIMGVRSSQILFTRCNALVYIDLFSPSASLDVANIYAARLDERLSELVCR